MAGFEEAARKLIEAVDEISENPESASSQPPMDSQETCQMGIVLETNDAEFA